MGGRALVSVEPTDPHTRGEWTVNKIYFNLYSSDCNDVHLFVAIFLTEIKHPESCDFYMSVGKYKEAILNLYIVI